MVQNSAARIITQTPLNEHITPVLRHLHWFPIRYRIQFKTLLFTYKALHNLAPSYLSELFHVYSPTRSLRSSASVTLVVPSVHLTTMGSRAFSCIAPKIWNTLPQDIRNSFSLSIFRFWFFLDYHILNDLVMLLGIAFSLYYFYCVVLFFFSSS